MKKKKDTEQRIKELEDSQDNNKKLTEEIKQAIEAIGTETQTNKQEIYESERVEKIKEELGDIEAAQKEAAEKEAAAKRSSKKKAAEERSSKQEAAEKEAALKKKYYVEKETYFLRGGDDANDWNTNNLEKPEVFSSNNDYKDLNKDYKNINSVVDDIEETLKNELSSKINEIANKIAGEIEKEKNERLENERLENERLKNERLEKYIQKSEVLSKFESIVEDKVNDYSPKEYYDSNQDKSYKDFMDDFTIDKFKESILGDEENKLYNAIIKDPYYSEDTRKNDIFIINDENIEFKSIDEKYKKIKKDIGEYFINKEREKYKFRENIIINDDLERKISNIKLDNPL